MAVSAKDDKRKVRFAVVGLGWIAQEVILPAFKHLKNSELVALVTSDPTKDAELKKKYEISETLSYDHYDELLRNGSINAVYITLPNSMHRDYAVRAAQAGGRGMPADDSRR